MAGYGKISSKGGSEGFAKQSMKIAIIGFGVEGKAVADYLVKKGHEITVCDVGDVAPKNTPGQKSLNLHFRCGANYLNDLHEFDLIFRSPGIPCSLGEFDAVRGKLTSETKYFFEKCPCEIVGVTGTKGKGTVVTLLNEMLVETMKKRGDDSKVYLGGNIGTPPLAFLDSLAPKDLVILELSSFQLEDLKQSPHVAVVLGITPDHMDHHKDMAEYVEAKKNIVKFQASADFAVLDADNELSSGFKKETTAQILEVSLSKAVAEGGFMKVGSFVINKGKTATIVGQKGATHLVGDHNIKNILVSATVAQLLGAPVEIITRVIKESKGLPHRLEFVGEINGARFYNDSASTTPEAAIAAVRAFSSPIILICGGSDKNISFSQLGEEIAARQNVKTVVLMGETAGKLESAIEKEVGAMQKTRKREIPLDLIRAESYQEAFMVAKMIAQPGDTVVLSPACASFDMFTNYCERGDIFRAFVADIASENI